MAKRSERYGAGAIIAHTKCERMLFPQSVVDQIAYGRAIPRTRKTMRASPIAERNGSRPPTLNDLYQNLDRRLKPRAGLHVRVSFMSLGVCRIVRRFARNCNVMRV